MVTQNPNGTFTVTLSQEAMLNLDALISAASHLRCKNFHGQPIEPSREVWDAWEDFSRLLRSSHETP